jgi:hypothetical protein
MGNFDGNKTNEYILPNGTILYSGDIVDETGVSGENQCKSLTNFIT